MPRLAILIISYNTRPELENCLASLASHPPHTEHEIVVVDNGSTDGTPGALRTRWPRVRLIEAGRNLGFAAANNLGIRSVDAELVLLLNSDTIVPAGTLDRLVEVLLSDGRIGAVGPRIEDATGRAELSFGRMMSPVNELRQKVLVALHDRRVSLVARYVECATRRRQTADWVSGACLLVRRADAIAAGLLDERYFLYAEDVDFCAALRALGRRIEFVPDVSIVHLRGRSGLQRQRATEEAYRRSQLAFYAKHHPRLALWLRWYLRLRRRLPPRPRP